MGNLASNKHGYIKLNGKLKMLAILYLLGIYLVEWAFKKIKPL